MAADEREADRRDEAHFVDRRVREAVSAIFREPDNSLVRMIVKRTQDLQPGEVRESLRRADLTVAFPATTFAISHRPQLQETGAEFKHDRASGPASSARGKLHQLISAGIVKPPVEIEVTFKGQRFTASIEADDLVHFDGQIYTSPSHAGGMVRNKINGPPPDGRLYWSTNGWTFWRYRDQAKDRLVPISKWLEAGGPLGRCRRPRKRRGTIGAC